MCARRVCRCHDPRGLGHGPCHNCDFVRGPCNLAISSFWVMLDLPDSLTRSILLGSLSERIVWAGGMWIQVWLLQSEWESPGYPDLRSAQEGRLPGLRAGSR